jgi:acetyltransferase-like isoleucine patch superfamily enzyme
VRPPWLPPAEEDLPVPVPDNVKIAPECQIWSALAFLHYRSRRPCGLRMGRRSVLWGFTMLDLGPDAEVAIGECSGLLEVTIATNGRVTVGDFAIIGHHVTIAGDSVSAPPGSGVRCDPRPQPIEIGDGVFIAANAVILPGARIGDGAVVGAGAVVDGEVSAGSIAFGNPYQVIAA